MKDNKAWEWLDKNQLSYDIWDKKYRYNNETFDQWLDRVSGGNNELRRLIESKKFLFGGRALANRGTNKKGSMFNCYSSGYAPDDIEGLMQLNTNLALTYKAQGGQGLSLTKIRPKGTPIGDEFTSDGIVPFMEMFNTTTSSISQGGARKGALMMSIDIRHKEAPTFITIKTNEDKITKANLSLEIDDEFMKAVDKYYSTGETVVLHESREYNGHIVEYDIVPIALYKLMINTVYDWGEPGCIFTNRFRNYNLMEFDTDYEIATCNPCLHPDTLIQTTEGLIKIKDMDKPMMVYCMDNDNKLAIRKASPSFVTKHNAQTINLTISNGNVLKVTPDHLIYIKNKGWVKACDVRVNDKPVALLRGRRGARYSGVRLSTCGKNEQVMEHKLVYEAHYGKIEDGYDIHHLDNDPQNNVYTNLEKLSHSEHASLTRYSCSNDHQLRDLNTGKFISSGNKPKIVIKNLDDRLKTNFKSVPRITKIEQGEVVDVYDITVDEFHNFVADGIIVHNCGEQPLPKNFSCNLGSLNLSEFVAYPYTRNAYFDWDEFYNAIDIAVEALDTIIDENLDRHALKEQSENSKNYRNIGLGVMGYANMLFKLGLTYGSKEAVQFTTELFRNMMHEALLVDIDLAIDKGAFPLCKPDKIAKSKLINKILPPSDIEPIEEYGLRNCSLISIAPTGSIATMLGVSGGCEPEFALSYTRKTENLNESYDVFCKSVEEYWKLTDRTIDKGNIKSLPKYFVTAKDINWKDRIDTQSVMQDYVDTAISSTVNLSKDTPIEEVEQIYLYAWKKGLKGITIYRSGCKREGILVEESKEQENNKTCNECLSYDNPNNLPRGYVVDTSDDLVGYKRKLNTGCGSIHMEVYADELTGELQETFINIGSSGGCERNYQFISRLISTALRGGIPIEVIIDQAKSIRPCTAYVSRTKTKGDTSPGTSCPVAIGLALQDLYNKTKDSYAEDELEVAETKPIKQIKSVKVNDKSICPECGSTLQNSGGCVICMGDETHPGCGWSKCD